MVEVTYATMTAAVAVPDGLTAVVKVVGCAAA